MSLDKALENTVDTKLNTKIENFEKTFTERSKSVEDVNIVIN